MTEHISYRKVFLHSAKAYDELVQSKYIRLIFRLEQDVVEKILSQINPQNKTLMDFACGTGRWTALLENYFAETTGVDVSEQMLSQAKLKCSRAKFVLTDITSETTDDALTARKFDVVTAFRFYKNAQDSLRKEVTAAIPKYLKDDGLFIFDLHLNTFSIMGILACIMRFFRFSRLFKIPVLQIRTISLGQIKKLFRDSELEVIDYYGMGVFPGRSNYIILPQKMLYKAESFFTRNKLLRNFSYNILVIAKKKERR